MRKCKCVESVHNYKAGNIYKYEKVQDTSLQWYHLITIGGQQQRVAHSTAFFNKYFTTSVWLTFKRASS